MMLIAARDQNGADAVCRFLRTSGWLGSCHLKESLTVKEASEKCPHILKEVQAFLELDSATRNVWASPKKDIPSSLTAYLCIFQTAESVFSGKAFYLYEVEFPHGCLPASGWIGRANAASMERMPSTAG